jgi:hypothetical protein
MRWKEALGILATLLLALPLVMLVRSMMNVGPATELQSGRRISPVLNVEERTSRATYRRSCEQNSDCEVPLGCLVDGRVWRTYCTDSQCTTDAQCPEGLVCRGVATQGDGPLVRLCIPVGPRKEGEQCEHLPARQDAACGPGLLCGGTKGWCGRPCQLGKQESCPTGFFCADVAPEPLCLPTCEKTGCPQDEQCIQYTEGASACARVYGRNCQQSTCAADEKCQILNATSGSVWMDCVHECSPERPSCPEGEFCSLVACLRRCDPERVDECGKDFRCEQRQPQKAWLCRPDW